MILGTKTPNLRHRLARTNRGIRYFVLEARSSFLVALQLPSAFQEVIHDRFVLLGDHRTICQIAEILQHHIHEFLREFGSKKHVDQLLSRGPPFWLLRGDIGSRNNPHVWVDQAKGQDMTVTRF